MEIYSTVNYFFWLRRGDRFCGRAKRCPWAITAIRIRIPGRTPSSHALKPDRVSSWEGAAACYSILHKRVEELLGRPKRCLVKFGPAVDRRESRAKLVMQQIRVMVDDLKAVALFRGFRTKGGHNHEAAGLHGLLMYRELSCPLQYRSCHHDLVFDSRMATGFKAGAVEAGGVRSARIAWLRTVSAELRNRLAMMPPTMISGQRETRK